jgi:glycosyltransferase involved in cell wall biosynthesis
VPELLSLFDIQVIPSLTEGFPLCLAEAMAAENAIVATEVGGMKEIGSDGDTVLFVPPKEPKALAEKILYLLKDKELANKMAKNAAHYSEVFSINNSVKLLEQEYDKLYRSVK